MLYRPTWRDALYLLLLSFTVGCTPGSLGVPYDIHQANTIDVSSAPTWIVPIAERAAAAWTSHGVPMTVGAEGIPLSVGYPDGDHLWGVFKYDGSIIMNPELETAINPNCPLEHELGHAIGMQHISQAGDLMSVYSSLTDDHGCEWTARDRAELCRVGGPCE